MLIDELTAALWKRRIYLGTGSAMIIKHINIDDFSLQDGKSRVPDNWPHIGILKLKSTDNDCDHVAKLYFYGNPPLLTIFSSIESAKLHKDYNFLNLLIDDITQMAYEHAVAHNPFASGNIGTSKFTDPELDLPARITFLDTCIVGYGPDLETKFHLKHKHLKSLKSELKVELYEDEHITKFGNYKRPIE